MRRPTTFDPGQVDVENQLRTLKEMLPYLWPAGEPGLRRRVVLASLQGADRGRFDLSLCAAVDRTGC